MTVIKFTKKFIRNILKRKSTQFPNNLVIDLFENKNTT
jgi:hypothetical protein